MSAEWPVSEEEGVYRASQAHGHYRLEIGSTLARFPLRWAPKYTAFNYKTFSYFVVVIHLDDVFVASITM
jgi:hypothetical protein